MKKILVAVFSTLVLAPLALAQHEQAGRLTRRLLTDDDDGKVEVWRRGDVAPMSARDASIRQPLIQVIFAGSGWQQSTKDTILAELRQMPMPEGIRPAAIAGTIDVPSPASVNDLAIQSILNRGFGDGSLSSRGEGVIHIVFLAPGITSALGASKPGADYDSYHSHVHMHEMNVRYVVVPWSDDAMLLRDAASNSAMRAVLNPDND
jgi:hypothetical protein